MPKRSSDSVVPSIILRPQRVSLWIYAENNQTVLFPAETLSVGAITDAPEKLGGDNKVATTIP